MALLWLSQILATEIPKDIVYSVFKFKIGKNVNKNVI